MFHDYSSSTTENTRAHKLRINHKLVALCVTVLLQRRHSHFADELDSNKCSNGHECWTDKHDVVVQCWFNLAPSKLIQAQRGHQPTHMHVKTHTQSHRAGLCTVRWHNTVHQRMHWTCCVAIWWCLGKLRPQDHTGCSYASNLNAHCTVIAFRDLEYIQPKQRHNWQCDCITVWKRIHSWVYRLCGILTCHMLTITFT